MFGPRAVDVGNGAVCYRDTGETGYGCCAQRRPFRCPVLMLLALFFFRVVVVDDGSVSK
jgi:hypothetical protein